MPSQEITEALMLTIDNDPELLPIAIRVSQAEFDTRSELCDYFDAWLYEELTEPDHTYPEPKPSDLQLDLAVAAWRQLDTEYLLDHYQTKAKEGA